MKYIHRLHHNNGFTLIELIMTIVIIGVIAIPLSLTIFAQVESAFYSQDLTIALNLGRLEMEGVYASPYTNIVSATFGNYQGYGYDVARVVTYAQGDGSSAESLKKIEVTVSRAGSTDVLVSFSTYIAKNVSYGL